MASAISLTDPAFQTFRITPTVFQSAQITLLSISTLLALTRTFLRFRRFQRLNLDDAFLVLATLANVAGGILSHFLLPTAYLQIAVSTFKIMPPPADFFASLPAVIKLDVVGAALGWATLLGVKLSFLCFFGDLVKGVRWSQTWWLACLVLTVCCGGALVFMPLYLCANFGDDFWISCSFGSLVDRESVYLKVTVCLDVISDAFVISVPVALLYKVKLSLRRKLALGVTLGLSIIMIIIAIIRVAFADLDGGIPDTVWLFFWQSMESSVSIIVVSVVAFRALLGPGITKGKRSTSTGTERSRTSVAKRRATVPGEESDEWHVLPRDEEAQREYGYWNRGLRSGHQGSQTRGSVELEAIEPTRLHELEDQRYVHELETEIVHAL